MGTMGGAVNGARRRVLVVDDEENVAHLVSSALRFDGFETVPPTPAPVRWPRWPSTSRTWWCST